MEQEVQQQAELAPNVAQMPEQIGGGGLSQDQVNKIVAREKQNAAERARRETEERYQAELSALRQAQEQRNSSVSREVDSDAIKQQVLEQLKSEFEERNQRQQMEQVATNYLSNVAKAEAGYGDFKEVTQNFDPTAFPQLTFLLSGMPDAGDVLYELSKNPEKLVVLDNLSQRSPRFAQAELLKLSKSIKDNKEALAQAQNQSVAQPLDRLNPSRISGTNGKMTISDLRSQPWMRV
jgi:hypothetical protein